MPDQKIAIAADHAGFELKAQLADVLRGAGYAVTDLGTYSADRVDYPDYGRALADAVASGAVTYGVGICGSGIGISIALNRNPKVRAALCHNTEAAKLAREHNDANVIVFGARLIDSAVAVEALKTFLSTSFEGGRHEARVKKLGTC